jgi:hypothetical protein
MLTTYMAIMGGAHFFGLGALPALFLIFGGN